jgi:2-methylcitrate dehydratase PrpD
VDDVFAGERNFFDAYGRQPDPSVLIRGLGKTYEIMNTNIKRWSVGSPIQAPLDALFELIRVHQIKASDVEKVVVRVAHHSANTVNNRNMPDVCMQHMCAVMLLDGTASFAAAHDVRRMRDRRVLALRSRIDLVGDDELQKIVQKRQGIVEVKLRDGTHLRHHTVAVRGTAGNPMTREEVDAKCFDLMAPVLGKGRSRKLCDSVWTLEQLSDLRKLRPLFQA